MMSIEPLRTELDAKAPTKQLIYVADPMCSWCWGFAPVMEEIVGGYKNRLSFHLIMGGLRAYNTAVMDENQKGYIRNHWEHVAERSGQPFDWAFFDRNDFVYDTEPACRAIVTARRLDATRGLAMMGRVQRAFYAENRDATSADVLADCGQEIGLDRTGFSQAFDSPAAREETARDFQTSQQAGISGFPTLLIGENGASHAVLSNGYQAFPAIKERLDAWLAGPSGETSPLEKRN